MNRTRALVAILLVTGSLASAAIEQQQQAPPPAQLADARVMALIGQTASALTARNFGEAMAKADESIALAETLGDRVGLAMSFLLKGRVFNRQSRFADSPPWYERALKEFEALGNKKGTADALAGIASAASGLGDKARAKEAGNRAVKLYEELGDDRARADTLYILVFSDAEPELREARLDEIWRIAERLDDDLFRAQVLRSRASGFFMASDFANAKTTYEAAIALFEKTDSIADKAATYLAFGRVFRAHGDYEGAIERYQKAIDLLTPTNERYALVEAYNAKAIALQNLKRPKEALAAYEHGLALARESRNQSLIDFMEGNIPAVLIDLGEYERAVALLEVVIARKPDRHTLGYRYNALSNALTGLGRWADSLTALDQSIEIAREFKQPDVLQSRLFLRVKTLSKLNDYERALRDAREAMAIIEEIRTRLIPSDFLKRGYGDTLQFGYRWTVDLLSHLGRDAEALEVSEQGRARAFLDLLAGRDSGTATAFGQPLGATDIQQVAGRLKSSLVSYWVTDDEVLVWLMDPQGRSAHVRLPVTRGKLAALVAATTAPLRPTPATATATTRGAADADAAELQMRGVGVAALARDNKSAWRELYKTLIEPLRAHLPARGGRITIVPHGPLFQLSFAALQQSSGRYLVEDYELHYAPSISVLDYTHRRQQAIAGNGGGAWAIVGNPATLPLVDDRPLPPLPGAAREVASIAALAPKGKAVRLDGAGADEASLARTLSTSHPWVLHFATHGFVFDDPKRAPFLALNRRGKTDADDGRLTLDEVYGLRLDTDLVVLSACRSGSGQVSSDGVIGLTRGFFYAGSPSVLATFWDVVDDATANLMSGFYRGYVTTHAKGSSLRSAQLALLRDLRAGKVVVTAGGRTVTLPEHPLLWAAFFLSGEP